MSVIQNGVMLFQAGHPFLDYVLNESYLNPPFNDQIPNSLTMAFKSFCSYSGDVLPLSQNFACDHNSTIGLITSEYLHPFTSWEAQDNGKLFFGPVENSIMMNDLLARLESSFTLNLYRTPKEIHSNSLFSHLARSYCPHVYRSLNT